MKKFLIIQDGIATAATFSESLEYAQLDYQAGLAVELPEGSLADIGWMYDADDETFSPPDGYTEPEVEPQWEQFTGYFSVPGQGGHELYQAILAKVAESGFAAQDHWQNFKLALSSQNSGVFAASIQYLRSLLAAENHTLSAAEVTQWNELMDQFDFPDGCKLS